MWVCRPICKSRRREWKGKTQHTTAELLVERKPVADCIRRWPMKVFPNKPCPLFERSKKVIIKDKSNTEIPPRSVVRLCAAPIDTIVQTPYLKFAEIAKRNGALDHVQAWCPFCMCGQCCSCGLRVYPMDDPDRMKVRRQEMRKFDIRVKYTYQQFRNMYD